MVKYICNDCPEPCEITVADGSDVPSCCPFRLTWKAVNWHEASENLQDKPLPKLTAEVFDRPDCPEWAKYASVHDEKLFFTDQEPWINEYGHLASANVDAEIKRILVVPFKSSEHYLSQVIERPTKDAFDKLLKNHAEQQANKILQKARKHRLSEQYHNGPEKENTLPEWCKVGEWVYADPDKIFGPAGYKKLKAIDGLELTFADGCCIYFSDKIQQARLRPYNAEEMMGLVGKVLCGNDTNFRAFILYADCSLDKIETLHYDYDAEELARDYTIDGQPAGVLEHLENGEWVK